MQACTVAQLTRRGRGGSCPRASGRETALPKIHIHPFNGPFSGTTQVSRYQKGKTYLDFTETRHSEWQWHQLGGPYASPHLAPDRQPRQHTATLFYRPDALPAAQPTASKH